MPRPGPRTCRPAACLYLTLLLGSALRAGAPDASPTPAAPREVVPAIIERIAAGLRPDDLGRVTEESVLEQLTADEREALSSGLIRFTIDQAAEVIVLCDSSIGPPFWLAERGFTRTGGAIGAGSRQFEAWRREFPAGEVRLGVNSLRGSGEQYVVALRPIAPGAGPVQISDLHPPSLATGTLVPGCAPYVDRTETLDAVSADLAGLTFLRTARADRTAGRIVDVFRTTRHPSSPLPDQIVLTWSDDPRTTQTVQWRTDTSVKEGVVMYQTEALADGFLPHPPLFARARTSVLVTPELLNDPRVHRHTAVLRGLAPATTYVYTAGDGTPEGTSARYEFTTAPAGEAAFRFIYMGDAQNGLDRWGSLVQTACRREPDAAFVVMAGDNVNRGAERDDWDDLFFNGAPLFATVTLVPALGNHDCQGGDPRLYLEQFDLPKDGCPELAPERTYGFQYAGAYIAVLDSNSDPEAQRAWLDVRLAQTPAKWKFVVFHHPIYSSSPGRDNKELRASWMPLFDAHHVDLVLQGHDHGYLRTWPMKADTRVEEPDEGTTYVVSVSGAKFYDQAEHPYTARGFTRTSTYQVLDIRLVNDALLYRAYDEFGDVVDELRIRKD